MIIEPSTYTAKFDIDGNGKDDTVTFDVTTGKGGTFLHAVATLDNGTTKDLGTASNADDATLSFAGKNGDAEGTFNVTTTEDGLSAVTFKGIQETAHDGWVDNYTGEPTPWGPDVQKWAHKEIVVTETPVSKTFAVTKS